MADTKKKSTTKYKFGQRELDMQDYIENIGYNVQNYLEDRRKNRGWTDEQVQEFSSAYNRLMDAFKQQLADGSNRFSTNDLGVINDSQGEFSNIDNDNIDPVGSQYYYNDKGERITTDDYNNLKDKKKKKYKTFNANRQVAEYFRIIGNKLKDIPKPETSKFDLSKHGFVAWWNKKYNPAGGEVNLTPFLDKDPVGTDGKRPVSNRAKMAAGWINEYLDWLKDQDLDYSNYDQFKDYDTYSAKGRELAQKWNDGIWNSDDLITGQAFGISNDFSNGFFTQDEKPNLTDQQREDIAAEKKAKEDKEKTEQIEKDKLNWIDSQIAAYNNSKPIYTQNNPFTSSFDSSYWYDSKGNLNEQRYYSAWGSNFIDPKTNTLNTNALNQYMQNFVQNPFREEYKKDISRNIVGLINQGIAQQIGSGKYQGMYYIPSRSDQGVNRALVFDPETKQMFYTFIGDIPSQWEIRRNKYDIDHGITKPNEAYRWKEGGVITTMQFGGNFGDSFKQSRDTYINNKASAAGLTPEEYIVRNRKTFGDKNALETNNGWNRYDTARLTATLGDIGAVITSFTPATIASAGIGAASTTGHLMADLEDGFDAGDVGRAALGYGLDALSLIPGIGAATKGWRIAKTIAKYAPRLIAAVGAVHTLTNGPEIIASIGKINEPSKMTVQDWQNIAQAITLVTAGGAAAGRHLKMKKADIQTLAGKTKYDAQTYNNGVLKLRRKSDGSVENLILTSKEAEAVKNAKTNQEIMDAIKHREGISDYELVTSTSMRPRFQWIRKNGQWHYPIHFSDKKARMMSLKRDQFTGKNYAEGKGFEKDQTNLTYKTKGELEEGAIKTDLAKARRQSEAYEKLLKDKEAKTTKFTKQRDEAKAASDKYKTDNGLTKSIDELLQIQKDLRVADYRVKQQQKHLDNLTRRANKPGAIKPETIKAQKQRLKDAQDEVKRLKGEVSNNAKWQNLSQPKRVAKLQEYIDEMRRMQKTLDATNNKLKTLESISDKGHTQAYQELLGRKKSDNTIDFNVDGKIITRDFNDILQKNNIFYKEGGKFTTIRKYGLGSSVKNVQGQADWFTDMYSHQSMKAWLNKINLSNYQDFNNLQDSWSDNLGKTKYDPDNPLQAKGEGTGLSTSVLSRQKEWEKTGTNAAIEAAVKAGKLVRNGGTDDNLQGHYQDGYFGAQEYLRHGGTSDSWTKHEDELNNLKEFFKNKNLDYYLDSVSGMYKLRPLNSNETPQNPNVSSDLSPESDSSQQQDDQVNQKGQFDQARKFNIDPMIGSITHNAYANMVNDKMTNRTLDAMRKSLTLYDFKNNTKYLEGDFDSLMGERQAAGQLIHLADQPLTSDGNAQKSAYTDAVIKSLDYIRQGNISHNQALRKSKDDIWQLKYDDKTFNYDVAMKNRQSIDDLVDNIANVENAHDAKEFTNNDILWQEGMVEAKQEANKRKAMAEQFSLSDIKNDVKYNLSDYAKQSGLPLSQDEEEAWQAIISGDKTYSELGGDDKEAKARLQKAYMSASRKATEIESNKIRAYYNIPQFNYSSVRKITAEDWFKRKPKNENGGTLELKNGSKIAITKIRERSKDADRFYKTIKDKQDRIDKAIARVDKKMYKRRDPEKRRK